ncbi:MAG TPA: Holliday junction branch migration protein RuvA [Thermomicrobiales bacterium]|nr:Holliday junction branch migration protein RuvA [Thermomicrobiales bacterium]HRA47447.1 Holliday junction branch migration protein RuvA [Thermomicrobiales bacterium]
MIAGLRGVITAKTDEAMLVDVNGVIYRVGTSTNTLAETGAVGDPVDLLTTLVVREDALTLFGFATTEEHRFFDVLTGVSGIGPRLACAVLSTFRPDSLFSAVQSGDVDLLATVPGVGKKTASRMIVELSGKLPEAQYVREVVLQDRDVIEALRSLGYSSGEVQEALVRAQIDAGMTTEERIVAALRQLGAS